MVCCRGPIVLLIVLLVERSVGISTSNLNLAGQEIRKIVGKDLKDLIKIPDQSFKKGKVYDIKVLSANYPNVKVSVKNSILTVEITNFNIALTGRWRIKLLLWIKASGSLSLKANGIGIKLKLNLNTLKVISCDDWIKKLDTKFSGSNIAGKILSFIAKTFKKLVNSRIKKALKGKICKAATGLIDKNRTKIAGLLGIPWPPAINTPKTTRRPRITPPIRPDCIRLGKPCPEEP